MSKVNIWIAMSQSAVDAYKEYPKGVMDEATYTILSKMHCARQVRAMFPPVTAGGKTYRLFSLYFSGSAKAKEAIDDLTDKWPNHFFVVAAHWMDGRQVGTQWELDQNGEVVFTLDDEGEKIYHTTGDPTYPLHNKAYKFMMTKVIKDMEGNVISTIIPTSNADLRDVNVMTYQAFRRFN